MSFDTHTAHPGSDTVVAPATGPNQTLDEATTSTAPSFRPVVTATPPPPPID